MVRARWLLVLLLFLSGPLFSQTVAYHPNPYWQVPGTLPASSKKFPFQTFFQQFGSAKRFTNGVWTDTAWKTWKQQNHFSEAYPLIGHAWQVVVQNNKAVFEQHPEYLAEVKGVRLGYGKTTKLCVSNKAVQALFIKDRIKAFEALHSPDGAVSVEPSDGGGFCECENCKKLGTISNQVFFLANSTAKALRRQYPDGKVNLLAYYEHAEVPSFDLEPNVHVTVVPQGFQNVYDDDAMIAIWARKAKLRTYYEYFAIPQWKGDLPRLEMQDFLRRMQLAQKLGYQGYWFEAGANINATIALQLFNQLWLNPKLSWETVTEQFLHTCFTGSYQPMKELFTRWWHTWLPEEEIPMALNNLQQATTLARSNEEQERIRDLKAYLHYIVLYQEWNKDRTKQPETKAVFDYVYNSANRMILHPAAFYSMFTKYLNKEQVTKYNLYIQNDWSWIKPLTAEMIELTFMGDLKKYGQKLNTFFYTDISKGLETALKKGVLQQTFEFPAQVSEKLFFYGKGLITINLINPIDIVSENDSGIYLSILGADGNVITRTFVSYQTKQLKLKLPRAGLYTLSALQFFSTQIKLTGPVIPILTYEQMKKFRKAEHKETKTNRARLQEEKQTTYYFIGA